MPQRHRQLANAVTTVRLAFTPSGFVLLVGLAAGVWAALGLAAARPVGAAAITLAATYLLQKIAFLTKTIRRLEALVTQNKDRAATDKAALSTRIERANRRIDASRRHTDRAMTLARETGVVLRAEIAGSQMEDKEWPDIDAEGVADPLLSIAVPGYNRPDALWQALESLVAQIDPEFADRVEIVITDDRSTDKLATEVAHQFARDYAFIGFRLNETNLGLERNLIRCAEPCRGTYLWVFGNDDLLGPESLKTILADLEGGEHDIVLIDKDRITKYGAEVAFRPGTRPIEIPYGEAHTFESILAVGQLTGLISTFGWIGQVIRRREAYMDVDAEPFFNTSLHPHLGMMLVAYPRSPVLFRSVIGVIHRTQDPRERLAEGAGRPEAAYMAGGMERDSRWFGAGYAAMLQRTIDRCEIEAVELLDQMEALWTDLPLVDWIADNWQYGLEHHLSLPDDVLDDAGRLFESLGLAVPERPMDRQKSGDSPAEITAASTDP